MKPNTGCVPFAISVSLRSHFFFFENRENTAINLPPYQRKENISSLISVMLRKQEERKQRSSPPSHLSLWLPPVFSSFLNLIFVNTTLHPVSDRDFFFVLFLSLRRRRAFTYPSKTVYSASGSALDGGCGLELVRRDRFGDGHCGVENGVQSRGE